MATNLKNLSEYESANLPDASNTRIGVVISEWNTQVTDALFNGAQTTLLKHGIKTENIIARYVPGSFELTLGAQLLMEYSDVDAVIVLGCVIQGETRHFEFICQGVSQGITQLNIKYNIPVIFGLLTTDNLQQALDRAGGKHGNKGDEAAITALKMVGLQQELETAFMNDYPKDFFDELENDDDFEDSDNE